MKYLLIFLVPFLLVACSNKESDPNPELRLVYPKNGSKIRVNTAFNVEVKNKAGKNFDYDSVLVSVGNKIILTVKEASKKALFTDLPIGYTNVFFSIYKGGNVIKDFSSQLLILQQKKERDLTFEKIEEFTHNRETYTQGLEFYKEYLLESSGLYNKSYLHQINPGDLKELKRVSIPSSYFAEGITVMNDQLYMLTWQEHTCFVYNPNSLELIKQFKYPINIEGWGLTNNGKELIMSDGTNNIYFINPADFSINRKISVFNYEGNAVRFLNELEYIDGLLYANIYQSEKVVVINPENGALEGVLDLEGILEDYYYDNTTDVLNGIAYQKETGTFYITGKNWPLMFRINIKGMD